MSSKDNLARIIDLAADYSAAAPARPKLQVVAKPSDPHGPFLSVSQGQYLRQMTMLRTNLATPAFPVQPAQKRIPCYE